MTEAVIRTHLSGFALLNDPRLNKGTAFSEEERDRFDLHGLLPPHVGTLEEQIARRRQVFDRLPTAFAKYTFMRELQDVNETLFYAFLMHSIEEMLPIVYTPTVGEGCRRFSEIWRRPRGLFLSYPNRQRMEAILGRKHYDRVQCIVVSDGERILGLGDQGAGGMGIPIGKMALYTALGGIHPVRCLPVLLDVGTDNEACLADPLYIGWRHRRIRGQEYDDFMEMFVTAVERRWPHVLLQWEDFAGTNATRLLHRYRNRLCTFNDDIQGTAAAALATLLAGVKKTGGQICDQRIAIFGFGSAGMGIADLLVKALMGEGLTQAEARARIYPIGRPGLLVEGAEGIHSDQMAFVRPRSDVEGWRMQTQGQIGLEDVIRNARITALIGVAAQAGVFTEGAIRALAQNTARPIIFPLSNPTSRCEATPEDLLHWTDGQAIVATGSPFAPVPYGGRRIAIDQANNSYIFPGLALGTLAARGRHVSDGMIMTAATTLAAQSHGESLLPPLTQSRTLSRVIAAAVARQAIREGLSALPEAGIDAAIADLLWDPVYAGYQVE